MAGRVLSQRNETKLRDAHGAIGDVLGQLGEEGDDERSSDNHVGEVRSFDLTRIEVREEEGEPVIQGYAAVFNRLSVVLWDFREMLLTGAFAETLDRDIRALWNHNTDHVLGRTTNGTLRLWEDTEGLGFELKPPATQVGRDAVTLIRRGDVNQMSFGFNIPPGGDRWAYDESNMLIRTIIRVDPLHEISPVTFPAYPDTSAGLRSILRTAPDWVQRALTHGGDDHNGDSQARARSAMLQRRLQLEALR